jgi:hypothetical protein
VLITHPHVDVALTDGTHLRLTGPELEHLGALRAALARHSETGDPAELERGFEAARALVEALPGSDPGVRPDLDGLRRFADALPELGELLTAAADASSAAVAAAGAHLWDALDLRSPVPTWTSIEHEAARTVFACACGPAPPQRPQWLPASLRRIYAGRLAELLCLELSDREAVWLRALGDRYGSLRHRCAPRTMFRSRGLSDLLRDDPDCRAAVRARLERWVASGADLSRLAGELEAAVVHARTPARMA